MLKFTARLLSVLALTLSIGIVIAQDDDMVDEEAVAAVTAVIVDDYGEYVNNHDAEGYVSLYAEDVIWSPPNGPEQTDAEGIQAAVQRLFDTFEFDVEPEVDEVEIYGDTAYAIGSLIGVLTPRAGGDDMKTHFRAIWIFSNEDDEWKIARQLWNNKPVEE